jgi:hypothetical protein
MSATVECFEAVSGLKINLAKSKLVPVRDVVDVESLTRLLGCRVASFGVDHYFIVRLQENYRVCFSSHLVFHELCLEG